jgi:hypothetical protein
VVEQAARMLKEIEATAPDLGGGTMGQILEIAANSRWAFFKYIRLRSRESFAKGKYLNRKKIMDSMFVFAKVDTTRSRRVASCLPCRVLDCSSRSMEDLLCVGHRFGHTGRSRNELRHVCDRCGSRGALGRKSSPPR